MFKKGRINEFRWGGQTGKPEGLGDELLRGYRKPNTPKTVFLTEKSKI